MKIIIIIVTMLVCGCDGTSSTAADAPLEIAPDAGHDGASANGKQKLVYIRGQSNARGIGLASDLPGLGHADLVDPFSLVPFEALYGNDATPQVTTDYPAGPLRPLADRNGVDRFGIELTLGRALEAAEPGRWAIAKFTADSTVLGGEWNPVGLYPMLPAGGPNLYAMSVAYEARAMADLDAELAVDVWIQGEGDAGSVLGGQQYGIRLAAFVGDVRYSERQLGIATPRPFVFGRLNATCYGLGVADERASQEANQGPLEIMVDQDPFPLRADDRTHYTSASLVGLGDAYAAAILSVAGDRP